MALPVARLFDFQAGTVIQSSQVDSEFNQIINELNNLPEKDGSVQTNLNADLLDGFHAINGGGANAIPVCDNTTIQTALNADLLDGQHASDIAAAAFDVGTAMVFYQASPPSGWTETSKPADHILGWKSGQAGGTNVANNWVVSGVTTTVANTVLTIANLPSHTHGLGSHNHDMGDHTHTLAVHKHDMDWDGDIGINHTLVDQNLDGTTTSVLSTEAFNDDTGNPTSSPESGTPSTNNTSAAVGNTSSTGSGSGHNHTATTTQDGTWRPPTSYVIIATKD